MGSLYVTTGSYLYVVSDKNPDCWKWWVFLYVQFGLLDNISSYVYWN